MASSDSEEFASADESNSTEGDHRRPRRISKKSSSNYDSEDGIAVKCPPKHPAAEPSPTSAVVVEATPTDGWDDFDIEDEENIPPASETSQPKRDTQKDQEDKPKKQCDQPTKQKTENSLIRKKEKAVNQEAGDGWDQFDDWGEEKNSSVQEKTVSRSDTETAHDEGVKSVAERLSTPSTAEAGGGGGGGWSWRGWGVESLLTTATAGISTLTSTVSQGISSVSNALESGIGIPEPEELARQTHRPSDQQPDRDSNTASPDDAGLVGKPSPADGTFALGSLMTGVGHLTKFVEDTGTKVISGGLDTLETIGKKTMEVLQDGDPRLAKKRAMLGLDSGEKPVLSQVLREAKTRADEEDLAREQKKEAKEVHYETLFDDFEGLVHLEALEMLSKQVGMRLEERLRTVAADKRKDMQETMQQVAELCELDDSDDEIDEVTTDRELNKPETLYNRLREATQDGVQLQLQPLVSQYEDALSWLATLDVSEAPARVVYKRGVRSLAQCTALAVQLYHKSSELLLVKQRRSTADEALALAQMTSVLTRHVSDLAAEFTRKLDSMSTDDTREQISTFVTNLFLEAGNSSTYIQSAFQLTLPILQIGVA